MSLPRLLLLNLILAVLFVPACARVLIYPLPEDNAERIISRTEHTYVQHILTKMEIIGESRCPSLANISNAATHVDVEIEITHKGHLIQTRLLRSSKNPKLDAAILDIIRYAAPYPPFEDDMQLDTIRIQKRWHFSAR